MPQAHEGAWLRPTAVGARLLVQVTPNAKKSEILGRQDGALKVKLQAQPVDGKANEALVRFIAARLGLPRRAVSLIHGATSRQKTLDIEGLEPALIERLLLDASAA